MIRRIALSLGVLASLVVAFGGAGQAAAEQAIRLGWQVPWATQGQLVMGLKHTNIPELTGIELEYVGFTYGGPLNRAALADEVDVLLTADQPALVLLSKIDRFKIVARMMYNRVCLYVPPQSGITRLQDLAGKRLMGPVGAAAERVAMAAIEAAGVDLGELHMGTLDMSQQAALLRSAEGKATWRGVDALYGFDPLPAVFESEGRARTIHCGKVVSLVLASRDMIESRGNELVGFLRAFALSWVYFSREPERANQWFSRESRLGVSNEVLDLAAAIEPNRWVESPDRIRLVLSETDYDIIGSAMDFLVARNIIRHAFDVREYVDLEPLRAALAGYDLEAAFARVDSLRREQ